MSIIEEHSNIYFDLQHAFINTHSMDPARNVKADVWSIFELREADIRIYSHTYITCSCVCHAAMYKVNMHLLTLTLPSCESTNPPLVYSQIQVFTSTLGFPTSKQSSENQRKSSAKWAAKNVKDSGTRTEKRWALGIIVNIKMEPQVGLLQHSVNRVSE